MKWFWLLLIGLFSPITAFADTITLLDGAIIEGEIISNTTEGFYLDSAAGEIFADFKYIGNVYPDGLDDPFEDGYICLKTLKTILSDKTLLNKSENKELIKECAVMLNYSSRLKLYQDYQYENTFKTSIVNIGLGYGYLNYQKDIKMTAFTAGSQILTLILAINNGNQFITQNQSLNNAMLLISFISTLYITFIHPVVYVNKSNAKLRETLMLDDELNDTGEELTPSEFVPSEFRINLSLINRPF